MTAQSTPGPTPNTVRTADGKVLTVPDGWSLVLPGDPALTRRIKAAGDHYADAKRREKAQSEYVEDFHGAVVTFLAFHPAHVDLANWLARAVTDHATPVRSGTVARTKRIPVEQRAASAVYAWMRHQTIPSNAREK